MKVNVFVCPYAHISLGDVNPAMPYPYNGECAACRAEGRTGVLNQFRGRYVLFADGGI